MPPLVAFAASESLAEDDELSVPADGAVRLHAYVIPVPVHETLRLALPPAEDMGLGEVTSEGALHEGAANGVAVHATLATALPLSPLFAVAMIRYVQLASTGPVMTLYEPCDGVTQPDVPLTAHWYEAIVAPPGQDIAITIGCPGNAELAETAAVQAIDSQVSV
jgi:hypothetical protein